jgi:hypothetical protein
MLLAALVRTVIIEMVGELVEHGHGVAFVVDQHPVGALGSDGAHEPLRVTVRSRCPRRDLHRVDALGGEHHVERCRELRVPVANEKPELADPVGASYPVTTIDLV